MRRVEIIGCLHVALGRLIRPGQRAHQERAAGICIVGQPVRLDPSDGMPLCKLIHQQVNPALIGSAAARAVEGDTADKILDLLTIIQRELEQENHSFCYIE